MAERYAEFLTGEQRDRLDSAIRDEGPSNGRSNAALRAGFYADMVKHAVPKW